MPMAAHLKHRDRITRQMFDRWLMLWRDATEAEMLPVAAQSIQAKAARIAESFKLALGSRTLQGIRWEGVSITRRVASATPVFDGTTLPAALRREHRTKDGVWGVIRVLEDEVRLVISDGSGDTILTPGCPGLVLPQQTHHVEPLGKILMQVEFYNVPPPPSR
jgi:tellurite resistance-related uncharacterized protein